MNFANIIASQDVVTVQPNCDDPIIAVAAVGIIVTFIIVSIVGSERASKVGDIECLRCGHVGPAKYHLGQSIEIVCKRCKSQEWRSVKPAEGSEPGHDQ